MRTLFLASLSLLALLSFAASPAAAAASPRARVVLHEDSRSGVTACAFNGLVGYCSPAASCNGTSILGTESDCGNQGQCCVHQNTVEPGCGKAAIKRAMEWSATQK